jgi:hypothetical protein
MADEIPEDVLAEQDAEERRAGRGLSEQPLGRKAPDDVLTEQYAEDRLAEVDLQGTDNRIVEDE